MSPCEPATHRDTAARCSPGTPPASRGTPRGRSSPLAPSTSAVGCGSLWRSFENSWTTCPTKTSWHPPPSSPASSAAPPQELRGGGEGEQRRRGGEEQRRRRGEGEQRRRGEQRRTRGEEQRRRGASIINHPSIRQSIHLSIYLSIHPVWLRNMVSPACPGS